MLGVEKLDKISVENLAAICRKVGGLTSRQTHTRPVAYKAIDGLAQETQQSILLAVDEAIANGASKYKRKRKATTAASGVDKAPSKKLKEVHLHTTLAEGGDLNTPQPGNEGIREEETGVPQSAYPQEPRMDGATAESLMNTDFLRSPTQEELDAIVAKFIEVTSNSALETGPCGSCARETPSRDLSKASIENTVYQKLLQPASHHAAHELTNSMLLYKEAVDMTNKQFKICMECVCSLKANKQPKHSLANNMWIGEVPRELKGLTLPERILIAKYYPAAYIIKLFPKQTGARNWDRAQMHNGLKGNVSTYKLDPKQVVSMIDGTSFPPSPRILSATIGITFLGPKGLPEATMPDMFRVRRRRIKEALIWLKKNNALYTDITISEENLQALPEDGVPPEIMLVAKYSSDVMAAEKEGAGYVPEDAGDDYDGTSKQR